jgi:hypothetical protein
VTEGVEDPDTARAERGPRGRLWVYAVAFGLLLVSTYFQFSGAIGSGGLTVVWSSIALSAAAVGLATAAVLAPGKRLQPEPVDSSSRGCSSKAEVDESPAAGVEPATGRHAAADAEPEHGAPATDDHGGEALGR